MRNHLRSRKLWDIVAETVSILSSPVAAVPSAITQKFRSITPILVTNRSKFVKSSVKALNELLNI